MDYWFKHILFWKIKMLHLRLIQGFPKTSFEYFYFIFMNCVRLKSSELDHNYYSLEINYCQSLIQLHQFVIVKN